MVLPGLTITDHNAHSASLTVSVAVADIETYAMTAHLPAAKRGCRRMPASARCLWGMGLSRHVRRRMERFYGSGR